MTKIILIHGNGGATVRDCWFPWLIQELDKLDVRVIAKNFPDPIKAREKHWLPFIKKLGADQNTILIGHSSGGVATMRFAEKNKILGSVLIGVNMTDLGDESEKVSGYYDDPWNWASIKKNQKWIMQFASVDDPYIPIEQPRQIHNNLETEYYEFTDQGHFDDVSGKKTFPELLDALKNHLK